MQTTCPHCAAVNDLAKLVADGCKKCGQRPNQGGKAVKR